MHARWGRAGQRGHRGDAEARRHQREDQPGVIGTVQILIGDEVVPSVRTTPEAPDLQAILATAVEKGVSAAAMEVSSHALAYGRTAGIRFETAAFLNLTQDHLDFHADFEDYFEAKAKLFTPDYTERAVVDVDDEHGRRIVERCRAAGVEVHTFSIKGAGADWSAGLTVVCVPAVLPACGIRVAHSARAARRTPAALLRTAEGARS